MKMELDLLGGGVLTAIVLATLGALLFAAAIGAYLLRQRRREEEAAEPVPRNARLAVSETAGMPDGRRLVLVRRDNIEHLILIGGPRDLVVESNIVRQRLAATAPGQRPAALRPVPPQPQRPIAAAGSAAAGSDGAVAAPAAVASPAAERGQGRAADPVVQERLRAASTALALRQAAAQPLQSDRPVDKPDAADPPPPAGSAVAGLAAGVAALTAAAGSRARSAASSDAGEADGADAQAVKGEPAVTADPKRNAPEQGGDGEQQAPAAETEAEEEGRAVFGLRGTPRASTASEKPQAPETAEPGGGASPTSNTASQDEPDGSVRTVDPAASKLTEAVEPTSPKVAAEPLAKESTPERLPEAMPAPAPPVPEGASGAATAEQGRAGALESPAEAAAPAGDENALTGRAESRPPVPQADRAQDEEHNRTSSPAAQATLPATPAARPQDGPTPLSGFVPGRGTTLGDLAERLEEALIQQAATGGSTEPTQLDAVTAEPMLATPVPPRPDEASAADRRQPDPAERDEAAVIDFTARRKSGNESLEEEMARLLGELTRDTSSR
jgi:flagellar protein FliO/FliZ